MKNQCSVTRLSVSWSLMLILFCNTECLSQSFNSVHDVYGYLAGHSFYSEDGSIRISFTGNLEIYANGQCLTGAGTVSYYETDRAGIQAYSPYGSLFRFVVLPKKSCITDGNEFYYARSFISKGKSNHQSTEKKQNKIPETPEYKGVLPNGAIDLGLSVKWGSCNIDATKPEEFGGYYAWGETITKQVYSEENYNWAWTGNRFKYGTSGQLREEDDIAHVKLGGKWRMPTDVEWEELRDKENCKWIRCQYKGIYGYLVTSKKTGNSIFLPDAGYRCDDNLEDAGSCGNYWSSSRNSVDFGFGAYSFLSSDKYGSRKYDKSEYLGLSVRPVSE